MEFILEFNDVLSEEMCENIIKKYDKDERKIKGDLMITSLPDWNDIDKHVSDVLSKYIDIYIDTIDKYCVEKSDTTFELLHDTGLKIQKDDYYKWREDSYYSNVDRKLSCIFYLNTLQVNDGGSTIFSCGKQIRPKCGSLLIFPSTWTYYHRGEEIYNREKYTITTFIVSDSVCV